MREGVGTGDVIVGVIAALGVVVMIVVFVVVVKTVFSNKDKK
ncbi:MAG: hypothetical protein NPIRA02_23870 [Nitrospirales bacterium]|nr:MAG: hypothetical protein NPIRA02_23870 [Nitrospirales bacterium]